MLVSTRSSSQAPSWTTWPWCTPGCMRLIGAGPATATSVLVCFDNEEIGSRTKQGAASPFLRTVLERILIAPGKDREDFFRSIYASYLLSADMGHGLHPNALEKHDPVNRPVLNGGPMIKVAANQNFTTDGDLVVIYEELCREAGIPVQRFVSRSDMRSGSTVGPISSAQLDVRSLDVGNPVSGHALDPRARRRPGSFSHQPVF